MMLFCQTETESTSPKTSMLYRIVSSVFFIICYFSRHLVVSVVLKCVIHLYFRGGAEYLSKVPENLKKPF